MPEIGDAAPGPRSTLIVGATGGIGSAVARAVSARGDRLILTARREEPLRALAEGLGASWVAGDSASEQDFAPVVADAEHLDLVVHAAGVMTRVPFREMTAEEFDETVRINLRSVFVVTRATLPLMRAGGRIVYISSTSGIRGLTNFSAYSASKGGMQAFAEALAGEVRPDGIQVHVLSPGPVATDMLGSATGDMRLLDPEDVADAVLFLDGMSPWVVVSDLVLRGGRTHGT